MKILMFHGRAGGHNILPFLEYFNTHIDHDLDFIYSNDRTYFPKKCRIRFTRFSFFPLRFWSNLRKIRGEYDLIWYHGGHSALIFFLFSFFRSRESKFIFNVWNEWLIQKAKKPGIRSKMFRYGIRRADIIHCNWHGTAEVLKETAWNTNIKVFYWGLQRENFIEAKKPQSTETRNFIASIPSGRVKFFFPKSISPNSRHDLVVEAAIMLLRKGLNNFIIYFWLGNTNDVDIMENLKRSIEKHHLNDHVILQSHGFLSFSDMQLIWKEMDVGLQIAANEQLSSTFLEPQFYRKEVIVTDILPYRIYEREFSPEIKLIPLEAGAVAEAMSQHIRGYRSSDAILDKRQQIVKENFHMDRNLQLIIDHYEAEACGSLP